MKHKVFIGLGSNLGNREGHLAGAVERFSGKLKVINSSGIYETDPWGFEDQPNFLNLAVEVQTDLEPDELLVFLKGIENEMGREETFRYGPRCIDLDILLFDDLVYTSKALTIPHPAMEVRTFVLVPLKEIAPDQIHPVLQKSITELADRIGSRGVKEYRK